MARIAGVDLPRDKRVEIGLYLWNRKNKRKPYFGRCRSRSEYSCKRSYK